MIHAPASRYWVSTGVTILLALTVLARLGPAQVRPYAPKLRVPTNLEGDPYLRLEARSIAQADVPSRAEVEAPPYPHARVIRTIPPRQRSTIDGEAYETLPVVVLITEDEPASVVAFYRRHLEGWSYGVFVGTPYFWRGQGGFNPFERSGKLTPSVQVREAGGLRLAPDARTEIHVRYWPGGGGVSSRDR